MCSLLRIFAWASCFLGLTGASGLAIAGRSAVCQEEDEDGDEKEEDEEEEEDEEVSGSGE